MTAIDSILRLYTQTIKRKLGKNCEIQILTPQVRGSLGTVSLNQKIQETVNPVSSNNIQIKIGDRFFRVRDRVIQTRNNYDLNVFNGDIGTIIKIDPEDYSTEVLFGAENRSVVYRKEDLVELKLAYAITIHKSQGSEFEAVIIPVSTQHFKMLFRNLIYTGLTRAKKLVVFVGSRKALALAIKSIDNRKRQTAVEFLLSEVPNQKGWVDTIWNRAYCGRQLSGVEATQNITDSNAINIALAKIAMATSWAKGEDEVEVDNNE